MKKAYLPGVLSIILLSSGLIRAAQVGIKTTFAKVIVSNLLIGKTYSLKQYINLPYEITNTSQVPVSVNLTVDKPASGETTLGFESVPDVRWITFKKPRLEVGPNQSAQSDITIAVPNDKRLLGKKYLAMIDARTIGPGTIQLGLRSRLLLEISRTRR